MTSDRRDLILLGALALGLRLVFLALAGVNAPLVGDELAYQQIAANVAAGRGFAQNNNPFFPGQVLYAWQAPFYPLNLAALYLVSGPSPIIAKLFGILLGIATVYPTFDLARRVFSASPPTQVNQALAKGGRGGIAFFAALVVAVYPGLLTNAHLVLSETLFTFLLVLAFDLMAAAIDAEAASSNLTNTSPGRGKGSVLSAINRSIGKFFPLSTRGEILIAAAGVVWGAATLTRGIALYFVVPLAVWMVVLWLDRTGVEGQGIIHKARHLPAGLALRRPIIFAVAMVAVIAPWTIRNWFVFHEFVSLETKGGVNFWLGNSPYTPNDFIRNVWKVGVREPMLAALPADELARDRAGYAMGEEFITREPLEFIARMPVKFADFWGFERNLVDAAEATRNGKAGGWNSPAKIAADLVSDASYVILVLLSVVGLVLAENDRWKLLLGGFIFYFVFVHMVVFGDGRFHIPLIPFLALYAAWFIANRASAGRWRSARGVIVLVGVMVFAAVWLHEMAAAWGALQGGL